MDPIKFPSPNFTQPGKKSSEHPCVVANTSSIYVWKIPVSDSSISSALFPEKQHGAQKWCMLSAPNGIGSLKSCALPEGCAVSKAIRRGHVNDNLVRYEIYPLWTNIALENLPSFECHKAWGSWRLLKCITSWDVHKPLPSTKSNSKFSPENQWLDDDDDLPFGMA